MNEILALAAVAIAASSGLAAAVCWRHPQAGDRVFVGSLLLASICGLAAAARAIFNVGVGGWSRPWGVPGGALAVEVDALSGMFLLSIFVVAPLSAIYGASYWSARDNPSTAPRLRAFYGLIVAGMALLVVARNSILFLLGWEVMALSAFLTITTEEHLPAVRETGYVYLVATRVGTFFVFATFAVLRAETGSFSLSCSTLDASTPRATAIFLLGLAGFGLKAGLMPLHVWLPGAHAHAPSHVSALMSGVLIKMGIYGLMRVCSFFTNIPAWWGEIVLLLGMVSAVLGVAFAIGQHDLKRLLAYHSVENIGIIVIGFGVALLGRAMGQAELVALGLAGALLHVWNHGLFKALLFLSAGSVIHATKARELEGFGGLFRKMPWTTVAFLVGAVAICGLPPLNGFVSELFVYLGMLRAGSMSLGMLGVSAALGVPVLALVGGLAAACFVKVIGIVFLGSPRGIHGRHAHESPRAMLGPMTVLAALCALIGAVPELVAPVLRNATSAWLGTQSAPSLSTLAPLRAVSWTNLLLIVAVLACGAVTLRGSWIANAVRGPTWDCGYSLPSSRMQYTASSFAERIVGIFSFALRPRTRAPDITGPFPLTASFESRVPDPVLDLWILPASRWSARVAASFRWIQRGSIHLYLFYIVGTLLLMLLIWR